MKTPAVKMSELVLSLPEKDQAIANKFIAERKFQDLYDLVKSDIKKVEKYTEEELISKNINIDGMNVLIAEIISYLDIIGWDDKDDYEDEEY